MSNETKKLPSWILIVTGVVAAMEIGVSVYMIVSPEFLADRVDLGGRGVDYLIYMWATRQFALGCIFVVALIRKSGPMLTVPYVFLLIVLIGDVVADALAKDESVVPASLVMSVVTISILVALIGKLIHSILKNS